MPAIVKKYPVYVTDEPISYKNFIGGINSDQSNEHLTDAELRDGLNVHFQSSGLVKRKGAKILSTLISDVTLNNIQGVFLYTYRVTYIIIAADGNLYYGLYSPNKDIKINKLPVYFYDVDESVINNPFNMKLGLEEYDNLSINQLPINHNGYVFNEPLVYNGIQCNYIGPFQALPENTLVKINDYVFLEGKYYLRLKTNYVISFVKPDNTEFWTGLSNEELEMVSEQTLLSWDSFKIEYNVGEIVVYNNNYYKCIKKHFVKNNNDITDSNSFLEVKRPLSTLVFQNTANVEGATYKNFLYVATGSRIVEVFLDSRNILVARVMLPKAIDAYVATEIGLNQLSPYPENCLATVNDQAITSVNTLNVLHKKINGKSYFELKPIMTIAGGDSLNDYSFRWEKLINGVWYVVKRFRDNVSNTFIFSTNNSLESFKLKNDLSYLIVDDADIYSYRVTIAKNFSIIESPTETTEIIYELETLKAYENPDVYDLKINKISGDFFGQATSSIYKEKTYNDLSLEPTSSPNLYQVLNTCKKIFADGNKFLFYNDSYSSGEWFKTVIDNPNYIALRGGLSFKTNKNEELIKVVSFAGNIIAFANAENIGGSIHLILGNGDDIESDQYYSPYRRKTISPDISTDNADTVQTAENLLFFKHYNTVYFIQAGELDNERVTLYSANDKVRYPNKNFSIPWDDNSCISEVTEDYYSLMWPEINIIENNEVLKVRDALRIKLYFKFYQNVMGKIYFSWLRDEGKAFNTRHILYINKKPMYLYNNSLVTMHDNNTWTDFGSIYPAKIIFKSYDLEKPKMYKLLDNITLLYNRDQYSNIEFTLKAFNEAGHTILDYQNEDLIQNLKTLKVGDDLNKNTVRLESTIIDSKVINTKYKFPFLLVQVELLNESEGDFSFGSLTFNYSTVDIPDQNPYSIYNSAIRKDDSYLTLPNRSSNAYVTPAEKVPVEITTIKVPVPTAATGSNVIGGGTTGPTIFISKQAPTDIKSGDLWYDIDD